DYFCDSWDSSRTHIF
nr:immunoglobulin light chain junction region [Macaca mulatta]MOW70226.1 immunoglobulin light chain junction region [Macaca mulatta]